MQLCNNVRVCVSVDARVIMETLRACAIRVATIAIGVRFVIHQSSDRDRQTWELHVEPVIFWLLTLLCVGSM